MITLIYNHFIGSIVCIKPAPTRTYIGAGSRSGRGARIEGKAN